MWDKYFVLDADIDLDPNLQGRQIFSHTVIQVFSGVFDGNDHTISHLTITGDSYLGLFGLLVYATVSNLGLEAVDVNGTGDYIGSLVGENHGNITSCYSSGSVSGNNNVGGLVGYNDGTLTQCNSTGVVNGNDYVGGLVGYNVWGSITTSYSTGSVSGKANVGGLVGVNDIESSISYSYSSGSVSGNDGVGGLVGSNSGNYDMWCGGCITASYSSNSVSGTGNYVGGLVGSNRVGPWGGGSITSSFWDIQTSTTLDGVGNFYSDTNGVVGKTAAEMMDPNTFMAAGWDFVGQPDGPHDIWAIPEGGGYPILWWQLPEGYGLPDFSGGTGEPNDPYLISTAEELNRISYNPRLMKCHFKLVESLNLAGFQFDPIGSPDFPYMGVFDGNGHTVSHLTIESCGNLGLFGYLACEAEVRNLGVVDANITGAGEHVGGLAGYNAGSIVECHSSGLVSGTWCDGHVGGLVGYNAGSINSSYSSVSVSGAGYISYPDYVGGLVGYNEWPGSISSSYSNGSVSGTDAVVGGLVGENYGTVNASFWDTQTSGQAKSDGGRGRTTAQMQTTSTFLDAGWDFVDETANGTEDIWWILEGQDYPRLWWEAAEQ